MKVSIVVPVYNEFETLPLVLQRILDASPTEGCERELIVVDDAQTDGATGLLDHKASGDAVVPAAQAPSGAKVRPRFRSDFRAQVADARCAS